MRRYLHPGFVIALLFIFVALVLPNRLAWITASSLAVFPLELLLLGFAVLVPGRSGWIIRSLAAFLLAVGVIFKLADMAAYRVFARPFNPILDAYLLGDGMNLLKGAIGQVGAFIVAVLLVALVVTIAVLAFLALGRCQRVLQGASGRVAAVLVVGLIAWGALFFSGWQRTSTPFYDQIAMHATHTVTSLVDLQSFHQQVNIDPYATAALNDSLFTKLQGKDVLVIFLESYGRTLLDNPEFAPYIRPALEQSGAELAAHGFATRSSYLTSPTVGGISWLAHGTALSGMWINSQVRYDSLMMSKRPSLNRLFMQAGWRTVAVMPAITMAWPEAQYFGYDQVYAANDLGYQGKPFNWVTMPDQYTLSAFQALERKPGPRPPVMAEIALISSHAPWTPIPQLINWDAVGDGTVFDPQATAGDTPETVWQNSQRIREQYRKSIEYALANLVSYITTYGDDNLVVLVMGDHQPAPLVTGDSDNRDVPVHLIARDPNVMDAVAGWRWSEGMVPAANVPAWGMDEIRNRFIATFSAPNTGVATVNAAKLSNQ